MGKGLILFWLSSIIISWVISKILITVIYNKFNSLLDEMNKYDSYDMKRINQWKKAIDVISSELDIMEDNMQKNVFIPIVNIFFVIGLVIVALKFISAMDIMKEDVEQLNLNAKTLSFMATFVLEKMPDGLEDDKIEEFTRNYILNNMEEDSELKEIIDIENKKDLFDWFIKEISYHVQKIRTTECQGKN